jgi:hypothetical protein
MNESLITLLSAASDILTAGVAIISFSLFIYSITFELHDRVTNSFTLLLLNLVVIFGSETFLAAVSEINLLNIFIRIHWVGIITLPAIYFYFSDAVLAMTGKPSKGKRRIARLIFSIISIVFVLLLTADLLIGDLITDQPPRPHLNRTLFNDLFAIYFVVVLALSWYNFIRAYQRTLTRTSRRRMLYLVVSALGPAVGSFPYLLYGSNFAANKQGFFWIVSILANASVYVSLVAMTYSISFYGFSWPDRLIRSRLFRWVMRGPITASLTLGVTILINRLSNQFNIPYSRELSIIGMVFTIVLFEYMITIFAPVWERLFFGYSSRAELEKVKRLENRLLTSNDFKQFLELILATICDRLQISRAQIIFRNGLSNQIIVTVGTKKGINAIRQAKIWKFLESREELALIEKYQSRTLIPIPYQVENDKSVLGVIVLYKNLNEIDEERYQALQKLVDRAAFALHEREDQERLLLSLEMLTPNTSAIQNMLAVSRFNQQRILDENGSMDSGKMAKSVKDALAQIWGGPKILRNPLLQLRVVQTKVQKKNESPVNAVREVLKEALSRLQPEGPRQYTNEWILYNIIDLKFFEGWKVKEIIRKLALSEADFYRKQRDAINGLSRQIIEMEADSIKGTD